MVITLGSPRVVGVVYGELLEVEVPMLAAGVGWPDEEWLTLFRDYGNFPGDLEEPRLEHGKLRFEARTDDMRRAWNAIEQRVQMTNRTYGAMLEPRNHTARDAEVARRDDVDDRIRTTQQLLDSLWGADR